MISSNTFLTLTTTIIHLTCYITRITNSTRLVTQKITVLATNTHSLISVLHTVLNRNDATALYEEVVRQTRSALTLQTRLETVEVSWLTFWCLGIKEVAVCTLLACVVLENYTERITWKRSANACLIHQRITEIACLATTIWKYALTEGIVRHADSVHYVELVVTFHTSLLLEDSASRISVSWRSHQTVELLAQEITGIASLAVKKIMVKYSAKSIDEFAEAISV